MLECFLAGSSNTAKRFTGLVKKQFQYSSLRATIVVKQVSFCLVIMSL